MAPNQPPQTTNNEQAAGINQVISSAQVKLSVLAQSCLCPGWSAVVANLLESRAALPPQVREISGSGAGEGWGGVGPLLLFFYSVFYSAWVGSLLLFAFFIHFFVVVFLLYFFSCFFFFRFFFLSRFDWCDYFFFLLA